MRENTFYNLVFSHYRSSTYNSIHYKPLNAPIINSNNLLARAILRAAFRFSSSSFSCKYAIKRGQTEGEDLVSKFCLRNASNLTYQISRPVLFIKRIVVARQICKWTLNAPPEIILPPFLSSSISNRSGCTTYARSYEVSSPGNAYSVALISCKNLLWNSASSISTGILRRIIAGAIKMSNVVVTKGRGWNRCRYLQRIKRPEIYPDRASTYLTRCTLGFSMKTIFLIGSKCDDPRVIILPRFFTSIPIEINETFLG